MKQPRQRPFSATVEQQESSLDYSVPSMPRIRYDAWRGHFREVFREELSRRYPTIHVYRTGGGISAGDLLEVNTRIVFRIAGSPSAVSALKREYALLRLLQGHLPLSIPNPVYVNVENDEPGRIFMGYPLLPGKPLHKEMLESIEGEETREALALQIAFFCMRYTIHPWLILPISPFQ